jgi:hypothetical protein
MLVIREEHSVKGSAEEEFDRVLREEWIPALGKSPDARVGFVARLAHGGGEAYRMVSYSFARDAAAWGRLVERIQTGDLQRPAARLDSLRYEVDSKLLVPLPWSRLQSLELERIPLDASRRPLALFMEDTVHPTRESSTSTSSAAATSTPRATRSRFRTCRGCSRSKPRTAPVSVGAGARRSCSGSACSSRMGCCIC